MTTVRLVNADRKTIAEFTRPEFNEAEIDLVEYTDQFGQKTYYIFADKTEEGVLVYRSIRKVGRVGHKSGS